MTFSFFTIPLCSLIDQFSLLLSLGFNWYPGMENSLTLSEQPSTLRKVASFACKISKRLDGSAVNDAFKFAIIAHFGMSLFHDAHVVMRSFPVGLTIWPMLAFQRPWNVILCQNHWMIEKVILFRKRYLESPTRFKGRRSESIAAQNKGKK